MHILVFDSGLGGLTVHSEIRKARPDARFTYLADDAAFPYGDLSAEALVQRVSAVIGHEMRRDPADMIVIACNTASTLVLPHLRAAYPVPVIGTVPAIKPAAQMSRSRMFSVMATPGTVARDYTRGLIDEFAADCEVTLVGCQHLAQLAEKHLRGGKIADEAIAAEMAAAFVQKNGRATDIIVLACTHYPLLGEALKRLAPWPVTWIDPAPAIARRVVQLAGRKPDGAAEADVGQVVFTSGRKPEAVLAAALRARYLTDNCSALVAVPPAPPTPLVT